MPKQQTVFISYSSKDRRLAETLAADLAGRGLRVWFDKVEILPGHDIIDSVYSAIRNSDFLAVIITRNSVKSKWVKEETEFAKLRQLEAGGITILPLLFGDCETPPHLKNLNHADFRASYGDGLASLLAAVEARAVGRAAAVGGPMSDFLHALGKHRLAEDPSSPVAHVDRLFVPPLEFETIGRVLSEHHCVFIIGDPHTGKTYTALSLLWRHFRDGYHPVWISYDVLSYKFRSQQYDTASLAREYFSPRTVIYIEDPFGSVLPNEIEAFNRGLRFLVAEAQASDVRVIITSRDYVIREAINDEFQRYFVVLSSSLKVSSSYTPEQLDRLVDNYVEFYAPALKGLLDAEPELRSELAGLAAPHNIEFCLRSLRHAGTREQVRLAVEQSRDLVAHLSGWFAKLPPEDALFLVVIGLFSEAAIPEREKRDVLAACLKDFRLLQTEGAIGVDLFDLLLERARDYVTQVQVKKHYPARTKIYIMGGPPQIRLASHQLRHPSYWEALSACIGRERVFGKIAERCVVNALDHPSITGVTRPEILEALDVFGKPTKTELSRAFTDISDNFMLDAALTILRASPSLMNGEVVRRLRLLRSTKREHVYFSLTKRLAPIFGRLPAALQEDLLGIGFEGGRECFGTHGNLAGIIITCYDALTPDMQHLAERALWAMIASDSLMAAEVTCAAIQDALVRKQFGSRFLADNYVKLLDAFTKSADYRIRGDAAALWGQASQNVYPELEFIYRRVLEDDHDYVKDVLRMGRDEAYWSWM